jgi:predicted O-methyltransferase YrrM
LENGFDLVYIDADKRHSADYYDLVVDKVRPNGLILVDNVLWDGKVTDDQVHDTDTQAIRAFNDKVQNDSRVENVLLPMRDGLMMIQKLPLPVF